MHSANNRSTRKILFILLDLLVLFIIMGICFKTLARLNRYDSYLLDSRITAEIYKTDGRVLRYQINRFPNADNGDIVYFYIALPQEKPFACNSLCTSTYNCDIEAVYDGKVIWKYQNTKSGKLQGYGNIFIDIPLPDEAFGKNLIIKCTPIKNAYINKLENVRLMPQAYSLRYPLINHEIDFLFCISIVVISLIAILLIMTLGKYSDIEREGIYLFLFFALIGIWKLGSNNTLYMITNNPEWCATVEYLAMFLIPVPYTLFLSIEYKKRCQKLFRLLGSFFAIVWLTATILNFTTDYRYYFFTDIERFLLLGGILLTSGLMIFNRQERTDSERVILIGTICSVSFMSAELIRFTLRSHINFRPLLSTSFGVYGIMIFVFSLSYGYYLKLYSELMHRKNVSLSNFCSISKGYLEIFCWSRFPY